MEYTLTTIPNTDIAYFKRTGPMNLDGRKQNRAFILDYCHNNGLRKVMVDTRKQMVSLSTLECFNFGAELSVLMKGLQVAVMHVSGDESIKYIIKSAASRGLHIDGFLDEKEAIEWLS